jgi:polysaccharide pyruvyl transferase WcaK-like protein
VVTGRMHLAIGSLGAGVPVMCIVYQGKFEGLMSHFDLPSDALISVAELADISSATAKIVSFIDRTDALKEQVSARLPSVLEHSRRNFAVFG